MRLTKPKFQLRDLLYPTLVVVTLFTIIMLVLDVDAMAKSHPLGCDGLWSVACCEFCGGEGQYLWTDGGWFAPDSCVCRGS